MARATRASALAEKQQNTPGAEVAASLPNSNDISNASAQNKKRKRQQSFSAPDDEALPPHKLPKTEDDPVSTEAEAVVRKMNKEDADKVLEVLEMIDGQGLLDRVFPLAASPLQEFSLRTLLSDPETHDLSVIRAAVNHLLPISLPCPSTSQSRARPSSPALRQHQFCTLALSLLEQVSSTPAASSSSDEDSNEYDALLPIPDEKETLPQVRNPRAKYALVQHLPSGDYWTSLSRSSTAPPSTGLGTAELVSILPSPAFPSSSQEERATLGTYHPLPPPRNYPMPHARKVSAGHFLDYGPNTSFAPVFEADGEEVGKEDLREVLARKMKRMKEKREKRMQGKMEVVSLKPKTRHDWAKAVNGVPNGHGEPGVQPEAEQDKLKRDLVEEMGLGEDVRKLLETAELETGVQELLVRTGRALERLDELQALRFLAPDGGTKDAEEGSEEWETAQQILNSLELLASLRPRASTDSEQSLVPSPKILHALHRTFPREPLPGRGRRGTLPPRDSTSKAVAVRGDVSVKVKPIPTPAPAPQPTPAAVPQQNTYSGYNYSYATNSAAAVGTMGGGYKTWAAYQPYAQYQQYAAAAAGYVPYNAATAASGGGAVANTVTGNKSAYVNSTMPQPGWPRSVQR